MKPWVSFFSVDKSSSSTFIIHIGTVWRYVDFVEKKNSCVCSMIFTAHIHFQLGANDTMHYLVGQSTCLIGWDLLPSCIHVGSSSPNRTLLHSQLVNVETNATIQEYGPLEILPSQYVPFLYWNTSAHPLLDSNYTGLYSCVTAGQATPETYQLNVVGKRNYKVIMDSDREPRINVYSVNCSFLVMVSHVKCNNTS